MTAADRSAQGVHRDLAWAMRQQAKRTGQSTPSVRGSDWRLATVTAVNADGTVDADGIPSIRCDESYLLPTVGDVIVVTQSSTGNWFAWGRGSTGGFALGSIVEKIKSGNTARPSVTAIAADPHLTFAVIPGTYKIDAVLFYDADSAADLKLGWTAPAGTTGTWWPGGSDSSNTTQAATTRWGAVTDIGTGTLPVAGIGAGTIVTCRPAGTAVVTTAGTLALAWAQQASSGTATTVRQFSWLSLRRTA
ncbi:hypothetical protein OG352_06555 [Streptomyces sp. NBC_01485]|uniref:hypothetical protein n=1 Tax=Streptomyces sp. NBC_01485 TaxID=2903884 RepID=UPI002E3397CF|nr:hypothetical protein [Streptomyces sp. NBC_01485]